MISVIIGGDICPVGNIQKAFIEGNAGEIFHDLLDDIVNADLSIVNLECPLIIKETPISKAGPVLSAPITTINGFITAKWHLLNLANNHSYDHGANGLRTTISTIKEAGLNCVGAGKGIKEANTPFVTKINDHRVVVYSMAEREFSVADEETSGSNPLDLINFVNTINLYKEQGTFIVLIHGGAEYYAFPSPEMVRRAHFMVDMGADAVICCHSHCPQPWEIYAEKPIVYGLGNLIFESSRKEPDIWYEGYLAKITIYEKKINFEAIPYLQSRQNQGILKMDKNQQKRFFDEMQVRSGIVKDIMLLKEQWFKNCRQKRDGYLSDLLGYSNLMRKASRLFLKIFHPKEKILNTLNLVQCETHREILNTIFKDERGIR